MGVLQKLREDAAAWRCRVGWLDLQLAEQLLRQARAERSEFSAEDAELLALAAVLVSYQLGQGEVCVDLLQLPHQPLGYEDVAAVPAVLSRLTPETLVGLPGVVTAALAEQAPAPLVMDGQRLYLFKYWRYEQRVAEHLMRLAAEPLQAPTSAQTRLFQQLFATQAVTESAEVDWQAVAAAVAMQRALVVISGGPGTGKTTTVTKLLALLAVAGDSGRAPVIKLAAPTGKAAARLTESIRQAKQKLALPDSLAQQVPDQAETLHRLLGPLLNRPQFRHHRDNPLHLDVLVVDEVSMVDLPLMAKLLDALPPQARLILLGDPQQLASVEAGSLLADLVNEDREMGYSEPLLQSLTDVTPWSRDALSTAWGTLTAVSSPLRDSLCKLRKSYRFQSGIGDVAKAVNAQDFPGLLQALEANAEVQWRPLQNVSLSAGAARPDSALVKLAQDGYRPYRDLVRQQAAPSQVLQAFDQCRVLAATREGAQGVVALNQATEQALFGHVGTWYAGRPLLITRNDYSLNLFNGDIGVVLHCPQRGQLRAYFPQQDGCRDIALSRLPEHETVFAMTIHKSQGSEFEHAILALPEQDLELLSKELLYTGITRAKSRCSLFAREEILRAAVARRTQRASGLRELLWQ